MVAASAGSGASGAALYLDALSGGGGRVTIVTDKFFLTDGTNNHSPFFYTGGSLFLDSAYIQSLTANKISGGTLDASVIGSGSITSAMLSSGAITAGKISAGAIDTSSLIVGGVVITGHLASNAITNSAVAFGGTTFIALNAWTTVTSISITSTGGILLISFTDYWTWNTNGPRGSYRIYRSDGTVINSVGLGGGSCPDYLIAAGSALDTTASAGAWTYYLQAEYVAGNQPTSQAPCLILTELKR
jgi:hypothetical protein